MRSGNLLAQLVRGMAGFKPRSPSFESTQFTSAMISSYSFSQPSGGAKLEESHCVLLVTVTQLPQQWLC